jgi:hypothetical protein
MLNLRLARFIARGWHNLEIYQNHILFIYLLYLCNIQLDSYLTGYHRQRGKHISNILMLNFQEKLFLQAKWKEKIF